MRKQKLVSDNIYHIYNRGVERRQIFLDIHDYGRFVRNLSIFNDEQPISNSIYRNIEKTEKKRKPIVDILAFCLMPNHYHLLLKQRTDDGITKFMRKLGDGYVKYFNLRYNRVGTLFQGKFKSVLIEDNSQFLYIPHYIHLNPLDLHCADWREKGIKSVKKALEFLESYQWSSYSNYIGESNFSFILDKNFLNDYSISPKSYKKDISEFIKDFDSAEISDFTLE